MPQDGAENAGDPERAAQPVNVTSVWEEEGSDRHEGHNTALFEF